jgi:hypothetical protein
MKINTVATLASDLPKLKKADVFEALLKLIENDTNEGNAPTFAYLYSQFQPARTAKPKNVFQWVAKAMAKKDVRFYLNYVYIDDEYVVATDGHRLHLTPNNELLAQGHYDRNENKIDIDEKFANYKRVIQFDGVEYHNAKYITKTVIHNTGDKLGDCYEMRIGDKTLAVTKKYFDDAVSFFKDEKHWLGVADNGSLQIKHGDKLAVIMPRRF